MSVSSTGSSFTSSLWTSASGLWDASYRLDTVAHNVANMNTNGFNPDRITATSISGGGVVSRLERTPPSDTPPENLFSHTDPATEMTNMVIAKRAYEANARVISETEDAWKALFSDEPENNKYA